jgi:hypothetical protein
MRLVLLGEDADSPGFSEDFALRNCNFENEASALGVVSHPNRNSLFRNPFRIKMERSQRNVARSLRLTLCCDVHLVYDFPVFGGQFIGICIE